MFLLTGDFARTLVRYLDGDDLLVLANVDARFYRAAVWQMLALDARWLRVEFLQRDWRLPRDFRYRRALRVMLMWSQRDAMASSLETEAVSVKRDRRFFSGLMGRNQYFAAQARYKLVTTRMEDLFAFSSRYSERTKKLTFLDVWARSSPSIIDNLKTFVVADPNEEDLHEALQT